MTDQRMVVTEDELEQRFRDDPQFALQLLHSDYRENIYRFIKSLGWWLNPHEIDDVYQETFCRLISAVRKPGFDPRKPMRLVQDIARKAAYDWTRRKKHRHIACIDAIYEQIADDVKDTAVGRKWLMTKPDWPKFQQALDTIIDDLPPKQQSAAKAFCDVYESLRRNDHSALAERIREMTGENVTTTQASDRWREAKVTIAYKLEQAGLKLLED